MDKKWMQLEGAERFNLEYINGVRSFLDFAYSRVDSEDGTILCPCTNCNNFHYYKRDVIEQHLIVTGIVKSYNPWVHHGEDVDLNEKEGDDIWGMLEDICRGPLGDSFGVRESIDNNEQGNVANLATSAKEPLYPGCTKFSKLSFIVRLLHIMSLNNWSQRSLTMLLQFFKEVLPDGGNVPDTFYEAKKVMRDLGLTYTKIDACKNDCVIYWGPNVDATKCPQCNESRWESERENGYKIPHKILRYFPIKVRLQRLFANKDLASDMRWHKDKRIAENNVLRHPADGIAWKEFDNIHESFSSDPRNVRLALSSDGFNPFSNMSTTYSMWPVILVNYNLPPWKAMKQPFFLLSLLIPGPKSPGNDIDVFLQPLIKDLKELWEDGVETYDASTEATFQLHAALLWTISDFPAYANLSGWSTKGKLACPVCNEETTSMRLSSGRKTCYMGHRRFLPTDHKWRENKATFDGSKEHRLPPKRLSGDEVLTQLNKCREVVFGKGRNGTGKRKREAYELNWTKCSIFFTLPYWHTLLLPHNLDIMHIEKNICESILGTLLNIPGKTKDTINSRLDLQTLGIKKDLHPISEGNKLIMPTACYTLSNEERRELCEYWKSLKLPDGYSSNISRCIGSDGRLAGMKSHDYHVFLQRLLPIAIRAFLPKDACEPLIEIGSFFKELCAKNLKVDVLKEIEKGLVITICKLERIFPPSFFDIMTHLPIHLANEALLGGPVQSRWMYPMERCMHTFKGYVTNKAHPEGSIAEAYVFNEGLNFCSLYLHGVESRHNREGRNFAGNNVEDGLSVFSCNGRVHGAFDYRSLTDAEWHKTHLYVIDNCVETQAFVDEHKNLLKSESNIKVDERHSKRFPIWFKSRVQELVDQSPDKVNEQLKALACGPDQHVKHFNRCIINGYRFHTTDLELNRKTQNNGVYVVGEHEGRDIDFYGILQDIIELEYRESNSVVLFKCDWWNLKPRQGLHGIQKDNYGLTSVNVGSKWYKDQPYILAYQAGQAYYVPDIKLGGSWRIVIKNSPRDDFQFPEKPGVENMEVANDPFQELVGNKVNVMMEIDDNDVQLRRFDVPGIEFNGDAIN